MASIINASSTGSGGIVQTADASGVLQLQANGTTIATVQSTGLNLGSNGLVFSDSTTQVSGNITVGSILEYNANTSLPQSAFGKLVTSNTGTATTLTLPTVAGNSGKVITISNLGSGIVTVNAGENTSAIFVNGFTYTGSPASFYMGQGQSVQLTNDGANWKAVQSASWGLGAQNQSWQDLSASRALGTTYTNTTGRPIFIMIQLQQATAGIGFAITIGGITYNAFQQNVNTNFTVSATLVVPNTVSYSVQAQSGESVGNWFELR